MIIALAGKGGVGKSTIASLVVKYLVERQKTPILAVDADPNSTLAEKLGLEALSTVGDLRETALENKYTSPVGVPKQRALECEIEQTVAEGSGFDLLVMGRGEGPGCYCSVNNMLRTFMDRLSSRYTNVVVDNEAGMEHLSRRTNEKVELMLVVCDPTPTGLQAARRIANLSRDLGIVEGRMGLVVNRADEPFSNERALEIVGLDSFGTIPDDPLVKEFEYGSKPILKLPPESLAFRTVSEMLERLGV